MTRDKIRTMGAVIVWLAVNTCPLGLPVYADTGAPAPPSVAESDGVTAQPPIEKANQAPVAPPAGGKLEGRAALHVAVIKGQVEMVKFLLSNNADPNARDVEGRTPLHYAASQNQMEIAHMLIAHGSDVNARDRQGRSVLEAAGYMAAPDLAREVEPGMVVCIDRTASGSLIVSAKAYDRAVAGIISGAGGVSTGMKMGQIDTLAYGAHLVALTGRVYCWVDASDAPIAPGDLLTTSDTLGHAMKVQDMDRAQGAIIGKAMTGLKEGKGLALVLVALH